nr:hemolysin III family protein [Chloroflexaceae bacterium]
MPHTNKHHSVVAAVCEKPLLRGWSHATAAFAAVGITVLLLTQTWHNLSLWLALLIFGVTKILLYAVSAIFHIGNWRGRLYQLLHTFDFANIFLFIAG